MLLHVHPLQNIYSVLLRSVEASPQYVLLLLSFTAESWRIVRINQGQTLSGANHVRGAARASASGLSESRAVPRHLAEAIP
jgi:hypothetical protein